MKGAHIGWSYRSLSSSIISGLVLFLKVHSLLLWTQYTELALVVFD